MSLRRYNLFKNQEKTEFIKSYLDNFYKNNRSYYESKYPKRVFKEELNLKEKLTPKQKKALYKKLNNIRYVYIRFSLRGVHINVLYPNGKVAKVYSGGSFGFTKAERYNHVNLKYMCDSISDSLEENSIIFVLKGFGKNRQRVLRFLLRGKLKNASLGIFDLSDIPYNGCRPRKLRRK